MEQNLNRKALKGRMAKQEEEVVNAGWSLFNEFCEKWCCCFGCWSTGATDDHEFIRIY